MPEMYVDKDRKSILESPSTFPLVCLAMTLLWFLLGWLLPVVADPVRYIPPFLAHNIDPMSLRGTFGDMFGAANALFSALAFAGVIYAILAQREELQLQRDEMRESRQALQGQLLEAFHARQLSARPLVRARVDEFIIDFPHFTDPRAFIALTEGRGIGLPVRVKIRLVNETPDVAISVKTVVDMFDPAAQEASAPMIVHVSLISHDDAPGLVNKFSLHLPVSTLCAAFRGRQLSDEGSLPRLRVVTCFKNVLGASFDNMEVFIPNVEAISPHLGDFLEAFGSQPPTGMERKLRVNERLLDANWQYMVMPVEADAESFHHSVVDLGSLQKPKSDSMDQ